MTASSRKLKRVLMVCTGNLDRSPTAAMLLAEMAAPVWISSAGTERWAENQLTPEILDEADVICVMEDQHRSAILRRFGERHAAKMVVLGVGDFYTCGEPRLRELLRPRLLEALAIVARDGRSDS